MDNTLFKEIAAISSKVESLKDKKIIMEIILDFVDSGNNITKLKENIRNIELEIIPLEAEFNEKFAVLETERNNKKL
jgi:hypothetical protein